MSFLSMFACSVSVAICVVAAELVLLFVYLQVSKTRVQLQEAFLKYRYLLLLIAAVQLSWLIAVICWAEPSHTEIVEPEKRNAAFARLYSRGLPSYEKETPMGIIEFEEFTGKDGPKYVLIRGRITGIYPHNSLHGLHIHDFANFTHGCDSTGGHYNPTKSDHGDVAKPLAQRHVGDLGNVHANLHGLVDVNIKDLIIRLSGDTAFNVIGHPLVIHADPDDLGLGDMPASKLNGNAGKRLSCGIIEKQ